MWAVPMTYRSEELPFMAVVRKKNKQTGSVSWLSLTTAILELERDNKQPQVNYENMFRRGYIQMTPFAAYEYMD